MIICFLGRQPELGLAELQAVFRRTPQLINDHIASLDIGIDSALAKASQLGSIIKLAKVVDDNFVVSQASLNELVTKLFGNTTGKITLGISYYSHGASKQSAISLGQELKRILREHNHSARLVPSTAPTLSSAAVLHNGLAHDNPKKVELNIIEHLLCRTIFVQDIDAYTLRDRRRPRRDARNGMLPPKLAQTMINLAWGAASPDLRQLPANRLNLLDPFCGTGVILQEASLMGLPTCGTDLNPAMVDNTMVNLQWLQQTYRLDQLPEPLLTSGDATRFDWQTWAQQPINLVASETYLGQPYTKLPPADQLKHNITTCNTIIQKFLRNLAQQLPSGAGICLGVPAWFNRDRIYHLPCLELIESYGYRNMTTGANLIYHRPGQVVGRELIVLQKR